MSPSSLSLTSIRHCSPCVSVFSLSYLNPTSFSLSLSLSLSRIKSIIFVPRVRNGGEKKKKRKTRLTWSTRCTDGSHRTGTRYLADASAGNSPTGSGMSSRHATIVLLDHRLSTASSAPMLNRLAGSSAYSTRTDGGIALSMLLDNTDPWSWPWITDTYTGLLHKTTAVGVSARIVQGVPPRYPRNRHTLYDIGFGSSRDTRIVLR